MLFGPKTALVESEVFSTTSSFSCSSTTWIAWYSTPAVWMAVYKNGLEYFASQIVVSFLFLISASLIQYFVNSDFLERISTSKSMIFCLVYRSFSSEIAFCYAISIWTTRCWHQLNVPATPTRVQMSLRNSLFNINCRLELASQNWLNKQRRARMHLVAKQC